MANPTLSGIYQRLSEQEEYHPGSAELFTDWSLEAGDTISIGKNGKQYSMPVFSNTISWFGSPKVVVESNGSKEREPISKLSKQKYASGGGGLNNAKSMNRLIRDIDEQKGYMNTYVLGDDGLINTTMWQNKENLGMLAGEMEVDEDGMVHIKEGSGLVIDRDGSSFGLYDEGSLTAGIIATKINGVPSTKIMGKNIVITTADGDESDVEETVSEIQINTDGIRQIVQATDGTMTQIEQTISGISEWSKDTEGNLAELLLTSKEISQQVSDTSENVGRISVTTDTIRMTLQNHDELLSEIEQKQEQISLNVYGANNSLGQLVVKSDSISQRIKSADDKVSELKVTADGLVYTLNKSNEAIARFEVSQDRILGQIGNASTSISTIEQKANSIVTKVETANNGIAEIKVNVGSISSTVSNLSGRTSTLEQTANSITARVKTSEDNISMLQTSVNGISAVTGKFTVDARGQLHINSGTALLIDKSGGSFAVYDENSMTAGVIVNKINGGTVKIQAKNIQLDGYTTAKILDGQSISCSSLSTSGKITTTNLSVPSGSAYFAEAYIGAGNEGLSNSFVDVDASTSGNNVTLTFTLAGGGSIPVTFEKVGGGSASSIDLSNFAWHNSDSGWSTAGKTRLSSLQSLITAHKNDRGYISFDAKVNGGTGTKTYYVAIG